MADGSEGQERDAVPAGDEPSGPAENNHRASHIFFDGTGRRALFANAIALILIFVLCTGLAVVAYGIVNAPILRELVGSHPALTARAPGKHAQNRHEPALVATRNRHVGEAARQSMRLAFMAEEDTGAFISLMRNADSLDGIIPEWLSLRAEGARPEIVNTLVESPTLPWIKQNAPDLALYPMLKAEASTSDMLRFLASPATRQELVERIDVQLDTLGAAGIAIDFSEALPAGHRDTRLFLAALRQTLKSSNRQIIYIAPVGASTAEIASVSSATDYVLVQAHDNTGERHRSGPTASQGWFEDYLANVTRVVPSEKLILSIGSFAYDWKAHGTSELMSVQMAWDRMAASGAELRLDPGSLNATFDYADAEGTARSVWMLDAATVFNQASVALATAPAGIAIWRLGMEDPGVWRFLAKGLIPDDQTRAELTTTEAGYGAFEQAKGALLSAAPGSAGSRSLSFNESLGLIVGETMPEVPRQTEFAAWFPADPKSIALTFDDGPDAVFTPQILDILKERGARATFYMIGSKVMNDPGIARRALAEGHDVGNHSFLHPNLFQSSAERIAAELTATQRAFESELGVRSVLFRPPYAMTGYDYLEGVPALYSEATRLGYLFGGLDIDAFDYFVWTGDQLAQRVIDDVRDGNGQVVLLHDSGGDRRGTIEALPKIIDTLSAEGYRFVSTHELVGVSQEALVQPYVPETLASRTGSNIRAAGMAMGARFGGVLSFIAILAAVIGTARLAFIIAAAFAQRRRRQRQALRPIFRGSVAVLVPAFNEEKVIAKTVAGLLASTLGDRLTITVIDDGSSDRTSDVVRETFGNNSRVRVFRKENGGKAAALNYGIAMSHEDVLVAIDGDTVLLPDAVEHLIRPFTDDRIGAVAGKVVVGNKVNLLTRFQALEYLIGQGLERSAFELFDAIGVVPGAIGAWRRTALIEVGGYSTDTLAEDGDLTIALQRKGWKIVNALDAVALTEAPETLRPFLKQRFRWLFGTLQIAWKHKGAMAARPSGISLVTLPNIILQFLFTLIAPIMDAALLLLLAATAASLMLSADPVDLPTLQLLAAFWVGFQTLDLIAASIGVRLGGGRVTIDTVFLVLLQRITYRQLLYVTAIRALLAALKGTFVGWGKLVRTGRVMQPLA